MKPFLMFSIATLTGVGLVSTAGAGPAGPRGFVEGGLALGSGMDNAGYLEVDRGARLAGPGSGGPAFDLAGGYAFVPNLAIFGDLQYTSESTITGQNNDGDEQTYSVAYTSLSLGLRTGVPLGRGEVYAQLSLGLVLPFETERDQQMANGDSRTTTIGYNTGFGGRGELGYHFALNAHMYLAGGVRVQAFATDNVGRERVRTDQPSGNVERTVYSTDPNANNADRAEALSVQDLALRLGFGYRF